MVEACSGQSGDFGEVQWYEVPGDAVRLADESVSGYWLAQRNAIVISHGYARSGFVVRHEMLHALLRRGGHPRDPFLGTCAALVSCTGRCVQDAGRWVVSMPYDRVSADSVQITTDVRIEPTELDGERWVTLRALVRNPTSRPVLVVPPSFGPEGASFAYDVRGPKGGVSLIESAADSSSLAFAPNETKEFLFEFLGADTLTCFLLPPGQYVMRAGYAGAWAEYQTITVPR